LARLDAEARLRLSLPKVGVSGTLEDRLIGVAEAAGRLGLSKSKLYKTADEYSFTIRAGRALRFSSHGIDKWISGRAR
jgi:predicted DNA-binding transcriptional regulator AlpA